MQAEQPTLLACRDEQASGPNPSSLCRVDAHLASFKRDTILSRLRALNLEQAVKE